MSGSKQAQIIAIYDISGIQSYIFATNKLKEAIGASQIVHDVLYKKLPEKLGNKELEWQNEAYPTLDIADNKDGNIIYIGGGNAVVVYPDVPNMNKVTRKLQEELFKETRGQLRLCYASTEIKDASEYYELESKLRANLTQYKATTPPILPIRGFSIGSDDNETNDSNQLLFLKNNDALIGSYARCKKVEVMRETKEKIKKEIRSGQRAYLEADEFEVYRENGVKSFVGVIHIDGNTIGKKIQEFVKNLDGTLTEQLQKMRKLALEINQLYQTVLKATIEEIFKEEISKHKGEPDYTLPIRTIIADGDDITVIIKAELALSFTKVFLEKLKDGVKENDSILKVEQFPLSAGAGIAFVHDKFPFSVAYDIAEQLCRSAKKRGRYYQETKDFLSSPSSIDFQVIFSGITTNIMHYRKKNYIVPYGNNGELYSLIRRPYLLLEDKGDALSIDNFIDGLNKIKQSNIANNKLEALRHAYAESDNATTYIFNQIDSRQKEVDSFLPTEVFEVINGLDWFDDTEENHVTKVANYFDLLDMMNFYSSGGGDNV
ncbi:hypothetical protein NHG35_07765 [Aerococcaceae bacterium NML180378]|nr:hypothetical protein [Aerococcaceae bacterium NML180378]